MKESSLNDLEKRMFEATVGLCLAMLFTGLATAKHGAPGATTVGSCLADKGVAYDHIRLATFDGKPQVRFVADGNDYYPESVYPEFTSQDLSGVWYYDDQLAKLVQKGNGKLPDPSARANAIYRSGLKKVETPTSTQMAINAKVQGCFLEQRTSRSLWSFI